MRKKRRIPKILTIKKADIAQALYHDKNNTIDEIYKTLNISRATLYRYIGYIKTQGENKIVELLGA